MTGIQRTTGARARLVYDGHHGDGQARADRLPQATEIPRYIVQMREQMTSTDDSEAIFWGFVDATGMVLSTALGRSVGRSVGRWARGDLNPHILSDTGT